MTNTANAIRPLPIRIRPTSGESAEAYLRRLARANHLRPSYLRRYLNGSKNNHYGPIQPEQLAAVAGRSVSALQHALAGLTPRPKRPRSEPTATQQTDRRAEKAELFGAIRYAARTDELSIRALAERFGVHRRTVRQALAAPTPPARKKIVRPSYALHGMHGHIDAMLQTAPTIPIGHIWERLIDDHDATVSYATVRDYVTRQRGTHSDDGPNSDKIE
jgi:hypothetical protein